MQRQLRVGLIGLGKMGQNHLRVLSMLKNVELGFIYDASKETMEEGSKRFDVPAVTDLKSALKQVDAVVIATPTSTHYEYVQLASDYIKFIFVEKPMTDSLRTANQLGSLSRERDVTIQVGFIERFNPAVVELEKILKRSSRVINVDFIRTNKLSSRIKDVDVIFDLMIHDIDLALHLNGPVAEVHSYGTAENDMVSFASAILTHQNGRFSRLTASRITEKRIRQISATCDDMYVDCNLLKKEILINKQTIEQSYEYLSLASLEETVNVPSQEALLNEMFTFTNLAQSGRSRDYQFPGVQAATNAIEVATKIQQRICCP